MSKTILKMRIKGRNSLCVIFSEKKRISRKNAKKEDAGERKEKLYFKNKIQPLIRIENKSAWTNSFMLIGTMFLFQAVR